MVVRSEQDGGPTPGDAPVEERVGVVISEGQRREVWLRSDAGDDGLWHNVALFRRDGKLSTPDALSAGLDWHLPPRAALERASTLGETDWLELYQRALRPRPPLV